MRDEVSEDEQEPMPEAVSFPLDRMTVARFREMFPPLETDLKTQIILLLIF